MVQVKEKPINYVLVHEVPSTHILGIGERGDIGSRTRADGMRELFQEGVRFGAVDEIRFDCHRACVWSTIAASSHVFGGGHYYNPTSEIGQGSTEGSAGTSGRTMGGIERWEKVLESYHYLEVGNAKRPEVSGSDHGHASHLPHHLVTWVALDMGKDDAHRFFPLNLTQIERARAQKSDKIEVRDPDTDEKLSVDLDAQAVDDLYNLIHKHLLMHREYLGPYQTEVEAELRRILGGDVDPDNIPLTQIVDWSSLGYARDARNMAQGLGKGPKSHPLDHYHTELTLTGEGRKALIAYLLKHGGEIGGIGPPILGKISLRDVNDLEELVTHGLKSRYSLVFQRLLNEWMQKKIREAFGLVGNGALINHICQRAGESDGYCGRAGWRVGVGGKTPAEVLAGLGRLNSTVEDMWAQGREAWEQWVKTGNPDEIARWVSEHDLPGLGRAIRLIPPTPQQVSIWSKSDRPHTIYSRDHHNGTQPHDVGSMQDGGVEARWNGWQMPLPGVPTLGCVFEFDDNKLCGAIIEVLLDGIKSIAEECGGGPMLRQ